MRKLKKSDPSAVAEMMKSVVGIDDSFDDDDDDVEGE